MSQDKILAGYALMPGTESNPTDAGKDHSTIGVPLGTRLLRIIRLPRGWRLWTGTRDFKFGTYLELFEDGRILHCTTRVDEGDEMFWVRPSDETIRSKQ